MGYFEDILAQLNLRRTMSRMNRLYVEVLMFSSALERPT
jgi:hypothetical protein